MKKALVLVFSDLKHDARVTRQVKFLTKEFEVTLAAFGPGDASHQHFVIIQQNKLRLIRKIRIACWSLLGFYRKAWQVFHPYRKIEERLGETHWDVIVANDVDTLPMAARIRGNGNSRIAFDAHEYAPRHFEDRLLWRMIFQPMNIWACRTFIPQTEVMFTVGNGLAQAYQEAFGKQPIILTNAPWYQDIPARKSEPDQIRLVHHGIANPSRRLELLGEMMNHLDKRFSLDLFLVTSSYASGGTKDYIRRLKEQLESDPRIRVLPPVAGPDVVRTLSEYDAGVFLLPPENFNYANTLPNKLFDFIQARLAVIIGPSPEMASVVRKYDLGIVGDSFDPKSLAQLVIQMTREQLDGYKKNSARAARELCAERNEEIFLQAIGVSDSGKIR